MKYRKLTDINQEMTASENALQQADLDIEAQVLEKWKREYRRTDN